MTKSATRRQRVGRRHRLLHRSQSTSQTIILNQKATMTETKPEQPISTPPAEIIAEIKLPPLQSAAWRLERLFGGQRGPHAVGNASTASGENSAPPAAVIANTQSRSLVSSPQNQAKLLKKWLGTASGTAKSSSLSSIADCAKAVLDPSGKCATGRDLLLGFAKASDSEMSDGVATDGGAEGMDVDAPTKSYLVKTPREIEAYLLSLAIRSLWRSNRHAEAYQLSNKALLIVDAHLKECEGLISAAAGGQGGVGGLYPLRARLVRYRSLVLESLLSSAGSGSGEASEVVGVREDLATRYRMAVLAKDGDGMCTVLNLMLRDLLRGNQVEQAHKLLSNATFPIEAPPSNNQLLRYLYYSGRIRALRLEYTASFSALSQCLRKCPTNTGLGFRIAVQRLCVVVQLLMGEIPEREAFEGDGMRGEMRPYLEIARAVRKGDLAVFGETVTRHVQRFRLDGTFTLISRLEHSVVKAGLRRLKTSYSRISLKDVAIRLGLPSAKSAEFIVAKAVRDGVIDATIDHEGALSNRMI
ncbi:hypothetical protein HJC23_001934 [Cyclotella cryptica]|uniref:PCI domain-containing protein n=1 Tax=Cyclotella cryptica TaxID=29204 RepID=A0ABD3PC05_9STRA